MLAVLWSTKVSCQLEQSRAGRPLDMAKQWYRTNKTIGTVLFPPPVPACPMNPIVDSTRQERISLMSRFGYVERL